MTTRRPAAGDVPVLVVSEPLAAIAPGAVPVETLPSWRDGLFSTGGDPVLADMSVLGLLLTTPDAEAVSADPALGRLLAAAEIPLRDLGPDPAPGAVAEAALDLAMGRMRAAVLAAAGERAAMAELRRAHMQMQSDHAELETWVWDQLAPKHMQVRAWPATAATLELGPDPVFQPLPAPVRGFVSVDVHVADAAAAGAVEIRLIRPVGPEFEGMHARIPLPAGVSGWVRLTLPRAGGGDPEDALLALSFDAEDPKATLRLSLAPESPVAEFNLRTDAGPLPRPLALRVYRTLPRMPSPSLHDTRFPLPADGRTRLVRPLDLGPPEQLPYARGRVRRALRSYPDNPTVELWDHRDAILVHPSARRPVIARVQGLTAEALVQLRGIVQLSRHDTMEVAFAIGAVEAGSVGSVEEGLGHIGEWVHLLPSEWGEVWFEPPEALTGPVDLLLATAMPNMPFNRNAQALFHGFRVTCAGPAA